MSNSATEYLPTASETVPSASGQGSGSTHRNGHSDSGAGEGKSIWRRTIAAYIAAAEDERLDHGAVRLFMWLLERTFDFKNGGDGDGGILVDYGRMADRIKSPPTARRRIKVPKWKGGKRVGFVTLKRGDGPEHPKRDTIIEWLDQLEGAEYIWRERIKCAGWPRWKIFISSIIPKTLQRELFATTHESPSQRTHESPSQRTHESPSQRTHESPSQRTQSVRQNGLPNVQDQDRYRGEGRGVAKPTPHRLSILDLKDRLQVLIQNIKSLRSKPESYKRTLKKPIAEWIAEVEEKIPKLERSKSRDDVQRARDYRSKIERVTKDADSYERGALTPAAAATLANMTRKKEETERAIMGLDD